MTDTEAWARFRAAGGASEWDVGRCAREGRPEFLQCALLAGAGDVADAYEALCLRDPAPATDADRDRVERDRAMVHQLVDHALHPLDVQDGQWAPLRMAARWGCLEAIRTVKPHLKLRWWGRHMAPLCEAAAWGHLAVIEEFLKDPDANPNGSNTVFEEHRPIVYAVRHEQTDVVRLLLRDRRLRLAYVDPVILVKQYVEGPHGDKELRELYDLVLRRIEEEIRLRNAGLL